MNFSLNSGGKMRHKIKLIAATKNLAHQKRVLARQKSRPAVEKFGPTKKI